MKIKMVHGTLLVAILVMMSHQPASAQTPTLADYTAYPPFINQSVPPLITIVMSKDHRLFYKAYNDIMDLDNDGSIDTTYKDSIHYYGYFDSNKCYAYQNNRFEPTTVATGANLHFCSNTWSGNFLNWGTMARIDVIRKVLYGGYRSQDTSGTDSSGGGALTVLNRTLLTTDNHAWVKAYNGSDLPSLMPTSLLTGSSVSFCNLNTSSSETSSLLYVLDGYFPYAASTEVKQCIKTFEGTGSQNLVAPLLIATYNANVLVCNPLMLEGNCEKYTDTATGNVTYKPTGLIQRQGINTQGTSNPADDVILMKFALITGSYKANFSGGVLRSNIVDVNNEINAANGTIKRSTTSTIIKNIDSFKILQYNFSTGRYNVGGTEGNCTPSGTSSPAEGTCKSWGNPIGEMYYEAIRHIKGLTGPTTQFQLSSPDEGAPSTLSVESTWTDPYSNCPYCAKPFVLLFSDTFPSFDSDSLPGSYWPTAISTSDTPSVQTLITNSNINTLEGIGNVFTGESSAINDKACTSKAGNFASIRGLCIEEPTKQGSYYLAGLAHYAKTTDLRGDKQGDQKVTTYAVATNSPIPLLDFTIGSNKAQLVPIFHDGCPATTGFAGCTSVGQYGDNTKGSLADFKYCDNDTDWTTEQGAGYTSCFDILWDDSEYGQDYDLDIRYRIYVQTNAGAGTITVKTKGIYANSGHTNYAGYFITGVSGAGDYLEIRCGGSLAGSTDCDRASDGNGTATNTRTFTVTGSITGFLKDPLSYAAKYGGFEDKNGTNTPDLQEEWDKDGNGVPDTYFYAANPLQLETQLANAFAAILNRASSGTAASVLASSSTGEGALYQSFFFPTQFEGVREVKWTGYTQGLFIDGFGNLREDSNGDGRLVYQEDNIVVNSFDSATGNVLVKRFIDANGDGKADSTTPTATVGLTEVKGMWEAGSRLAQTASSARNLWTWADQDGDGIVDSGEFIPFTTSNSAKIGPYLRASAAPYTANNIINFIRGDQIAGLRDRQLMVGGTLQVWKLGDPIHATPVIVGGPKERHDVIYGDSTYTAFYQQYKDRRQVAYLGANDGMLHAINVGFYHRGDDPSTPAASQVEHGWFTRNPTDNSSGKFLGEEIWGFIPQELLPHLRWLAQPDYTHVYYVDLKPKITDARIFAPDADHPNGWGTILIGGFRMGGSCESCPATNGRRMRFSADFDNDPVTPDETRNFYSAYFVLDITNPEVNPKLLWVFSDAGQGFTTSYPAIIRVNPSGDVKTDNTNAEWFVVFGSGPTGYDGSIVQSAKLYAVNLSTGPGTGNSLVTTLPVGTWNSWMGDLVTLDKDLDYRTDVAYAGRVINDGSPPWKGKMYRLTTGGCGSAPCTTSTWGINSGSNRVPTEIIDTFAGSTEVGPITAAPAITLDDSGKIWLFFGTGRYYNTADKTNTETQYFFGIKDSVVGGSCTQTSTTSCLDDDLVNVSAAIICTVCTGNQVSGVTGVTTLEGTTTSSLQGLVQTKDGWYTTLPNSRERAITNPTILGGIVFFPTFVPVDDLCVASGDGYLYALFYLTGSAYKESVIGTSTSGGNTNVNRSVSLGTGTGLASQMAIQIGSQGSGGAGSGGGGGGCQSGVTGYIQSSTGTLSSYCTKVGGVSSRYISWNNQRL